MEVEKFSVDSNKKGSVVLVRVEGEIANPKVQVNLTYTVLGNGKLKVDYESNIDASAPNVPRVGMQFDVASSYQNLSYLGRDPQPNYINRNYGAEVGFYSGLVKTMSYRYVKSSEYGNHTNTRWFKIHNNSKGLLVKGDDLLSFVLYTRCAFRLY